MQCSVVWTKIIYLFVSICGYLYTGCYTCGNVLLNFSQDATWQQGRLNRNLLDSHRYLFPIATFVKDPLITVARTALSLVSNLDYLQALHHLPDFLRLHIGSRVYCLGHPKPFTHLIRVALFTPQPTNPWKIPGVDAELSIDLSAMSQCLIPTSHWCWLCESLGTSGWGWQWTREAQFGSCDFLQR